MDSVKGIHICTLPAGTRLAWHGDLIFAAHPDHPARVISISQEVDKHYPGYASIVQAFHIGADETD